MSLRSLRYSRRYLGAVKDSRTLFARTFKRAYDAICQEHGAENALSSFELAFSRSVASPTTEADQLAVKVAAGEVAASVTVELGEQIRASRDQLRRARAA
jgi:hypothetical protein